MMSKTKPSPKAKQSPKTKHPPRGIGRIAVNLAGILSAFAIAFGGLFLVQGRLSLEQNKLLEGGGKVELPQTGTAEAAEAATVSLRDSLAEEELLQLVHDLEQREEIKPHEPLEGQLTMIQAINCGETWLEEFFLSDATLNDLPAMDYRANCYLWTPETLEADPEASPWLGCWTVSLSNQNIDASLTLSAVTGQILDASVSCLAPVSRQGSGNLLTLLEKYASSFGLEGDNILISVEDKDANEKELLCFQSIGTRGLYAAIQAGNIIFAIADTDTETPLYMERFNVHLYLSSGPKIR